MALPQLNFKLRRRPHLPIVLQEEIAECGHACIVMLSQYWGQKIDLYSLRRQHKPSVRGITLRDVCAILNDVGLISRALRVPQSELSHVKLPALLHWNHNHFVVLKEIKRQGYIIHDPASGIHVYTVTQFAEAFSGIVLEVEKAIDFSHLPPYPKLTLRNLIKNISGWQHFVAILIAMTGSLEILHLLNPLLLQYVSDHVISAYDMYNFYMLGCGAIIVILLQSLLEYARGHLVIYLSNHLTEAFSSNVMRHLLMLPLTFFTARHRGDIQAKFQSIEQIQKKISTDFINTFLDGFMVILNIIIMWLYSPRLTLIVLTSLIIFIGLRYATYQRHKQQIIYALQHHAKAATLFLETLQAIAPLKAFLQENMRLNLWRHRFIEALNAEIAVAKFQLIYQVGQQLLFNVEHIAVLGTGAYLVIHHQFSVGMLLAFLAFRLSLINKAATFIQSICDFKLIQVQLHRLSDIMLEMPEQVQSSKNTPLQPTGALSLENISFQYHAWDEPLFKPINLAISPGEKIAIIGSSGCGKTTLLKIMMGLLAPTSGIISIDGVTLSEFGLQNYRQHIAMVMQDDALLSGSIMENIAFFAEDIDIQHVYYVANIACVHDSILRMPMGYDTVLGDLGNTLSGGQKQRILLARALYKNPKILFLDEATSHLDVDNESAINLALKNLEITQIIVAHRPETIRMADRIVRLEH